MKDECWGWTLTNLFHRTRSSSLSWSGGAKNRQLGVDRSRATRTWITAGETGKIGMSQEGGEGTDEGVKWQPCHSRERGRESLEVHGIEVDLCEYYSKILASLVHSNRQACHNVCSLWNPRPFNLTHCQSLVFHKLHTGHHWHSFTSLFERNGQRVMIKTSEHFVQDLGFFEKFLSSFRVFIIFLSRFRVFVFFLASFRVFVFFLTSFKVSLMVLAVLRVNKYIKPWLKGCPTLPAFYRVRLARIHALYFRLADEASRSKS